MKYIIKAIGHELLGFLIVATIGALVYGLCTLLIWAFGDYAFAVGFVIVFVALQIIIVLQKAMQFKREAESKAHYD